MVKNELIEQDWYGGEWPKPSKLIMKLSHKDGITSVRFIHSDAPKDEEQDFVEGWQDYYFGIIKSLLEK